MSFLRQGRSPFGARIRSPFGARTAANSPALTSAGIATASAIARYAGYTAIVHSAQFYSQDDVGSYGSGVTTRIVNRTMVFSSDVMGKHFASIFRRSRAGFFINIPAWGAPPTSAIFTFNTFGGTSASESALPQIYVSAVDQSAFTLGWQDDLAVAGGIGVITGGVSVTKAQTIAVPVSALRPNANNSFVIGQSFELVTGGVSTSPAQSEFKFTPGGLSITLTLS